MTHRNTKRTLTSALFSPAPIPTQAIPFEFDMAFDRASTKQGYTIPQAAREIKRIAENGQVRLAKNALKDAKSVIALVLQNPVHKKLYLEINCEPLHKVEEWLNNQHVASEEEMLFVAKENHKKQCEADAENTRNSKINIIINSMNQANRFSNLQPSLALAIYQRLLSDYPRDNDLNDTEKKIHAAEDPDSLYRLSLEHHPEFWGLKKNIYHLKQRYFADEKEVSRPPSVAPPISATLLKEMINHLYQFYTHQIREGRLGLPLDERKKHAYLKVFYLQLNIRYQDEHSKNRANINEDRKAFAKTHSTYLSHDEILFSANAALTEFHSKQCSEGDGFTLCHAHAQHYAWNHLSVLYQGSAYVLDAIEVYCTLINYALKKSPRNQLSDLAGIHYNLAAELLNEYLRTRDAFYTYSLVENRVIEFFYYTKAKIAYLGACSTDNYLNTFSSYPNNPYAALDEYKNFIGNNPSKYADWIRETKASLALPAHKRPKHIMPVRYGLSYTPISYEQQKANFIELKSSSLAFLEKARNENLQKLEEIFALSSKSPLHPFTQLENIIKKTCAWKDDFIAIDLLQHLTALVSLCFTCDTKGLEQFKQRFAVEEKQESKEIKAISTERKAAPPKATHPHPSTTISHIKAINIKEEKERSMALNSTSSETKSPKVTEGKKKKPKKKTRKKLSDIATKSVISSSIPYSPKETKLPISENHSLPSVKQEFKISGAISPADFFKGILSPDSYPLLMDLFHDAPITLHDHRVVSGIRITGGVTLRALTQFVIPEKPLAFELSDIDLHFMQNNFSRGIATALSHHEFEYKSSFRNTFALYTCSNYFNDEGKVVPCELTVVPEVARKSPNSIPLSQIKAVVEKETGKLYFTDVTPDIVQDIRNSLFRVAMPSLEPSAPHESYFLMRFSNYYYKLVVLSQWTADKNTTQKILHQDFLSRYLMKVKTHSDISFHQEISRLIIYHQKIIFSLTATAHEDKLLRAVLYPTIFAFFSVLLKTGPGFSTEPTLTCVPVLTELFLNYLKTTAFPERTNRQGYTEWLSQILTSFKDVKKPEGLTFDITTILNQCCAQIITPPTTVSHAVSTAGMYGASSMSSNSSSATTCSSYAMRSGPP